MRAPPTIEWHSQSEAETVAFGRQLGSLLRPGDVVLLQGPFGAGKTYFTKGIGSAFGVDVTSINSPSFVLVNEYTGRATGGHIPIYHADLYRIESDAALATVGLEETWNGDGIAIIEWPERAGAWLPADHLLIRFSVLGTDARTLRFDPSGARYVDLLEQLAEGPRSHVAGN